MDGSVYWLLSVVLIVVALFFMRLLRGPGQPGDKRQQEPTLAGIRDQIRRNMGDQAPLTMRRFVNRLAFPVAVCAVGFLVLWLLPNREVTVENLPPCTNKARGFCVVNGNTLRHGRDIIRLQDIDVPSMYAPSCASEEVLGQEAIRRLLQALENAESFEVIYTGGRDMDPRGRQLRVLMIDGKPVGDMLVAEGLARHWDGPPRNWCP